MYTTWNMPNLQHIMVGDNTFPLILCNLPLYNIHELSVVSVPNMSVTSWMFNFLTVWSHIRMCRLLHTIRFISVVPDSTQCIHTLIQALRFTNIKNMYLFPCTFMNAVFILNYTNITL